MMDLQNTILIVDDTQTNIDILVELLNEYDLVIATNGQDALDILEEEKVDLILLDIMMPVMDGFEVCKKIKSNNKTASIPVMFLTAKSDDDSIQKGFEIGGIDYITKPFRPIELLSRVKTHINLKKHESKLIEHNKYIALNELINNIAHQWRQPLSAISTISSGIIMQHEFGMLKDEELLKSCENITQNTLYLSSTIDNFQNLTNNQNDVSTFHIQNLINKNSNILFDNLSQNGIQIEIKLQDEIKIQGIENQFLEIILHLLSNAQDSLLESNIDKKVILIDSEIQKKGIVINFYNNGLYINNDIIHKIYEPYFTTKHQSMGTGLGLYMVHKFMNETFNGDIKASNTSFYYGDELHKGVKFELFFPLC